MNSAGPTGPKLVKTATEWREPLAPKQYLVTWEHGTERTFAGPIRPPVLRYSQV
jgi:hypothetical protein